jgi:biopolymer transport protein ExbD
MKLQPKEAGEDIEMDMSPMIDMVFLLLIFFIVASQIVDTKPKVSIPKAAAAKVPEDIEGRMMVTVNKDDQYFVRMDEMADFEELSMKIAQEAVANPEVRILIRADAEVPFKTTEKLMMVCAENGLVDIIFAAIEE